MAITKGGIFTTCYHCGLIWLTGYEDYVPRRSPARKSWEERVKKEGKRFQCCRSCGTVTDRLKS